VIAHIRYVHVSVKATHVRMSLLGQLLSIDESCKVEGTEWEGKWTKDVHLILALCRYYDSHPDDMHSSHLYC
jgi:hypothetical protein